jgi:oligopeptide/dipeptide ABC transporter ATP-binding protein
MEHPLLAVKGLKTHFHTFGGVIPAVDGVDLSLGQGEILGVVGESGGGKSVLGFSIIGLIDPPGRIVAGEIWFAGRRLDNQGEEQLRRVRGKEITMIFQDPMTSLNPLYTIQDQMEEVMRLHDALTAAERRQRCIRLLMEVGIPQPESRLKNYPHQFSGGMRQRVIIAIALASRPKLVIADEPTTALDVTIQAQILTLMRRLVKEHGTALMLITHDLAVVAQMADAIIVMYCGRIVERGRARDIVRGSRHPYTRGLLASIPKLTGGGRRLQQIPGMAPDVRRLPPGCAFAPRCERSRDRCRSEDPRLVARAAGHDVACHFPLEG